MKKILIIEDEVDVASTLKMYLEGAGYQAEFTLDAMNGVSMAKDFDLVLLDLIMPVVSGRAVLKEMKAKKIKTPIIVLSAVGLPMTVGQELISMYPGLIFIKKTSMRAELLGAIDKLIGK